MAKQKKISTKTKRQHPQTKTNLHKKPPTKKKKSYKVRNWHEYNEALKNRGRIDIWVEKGMLEQWYAKQSGKRGAQEKYSDLAIRITRQIGIVYHQKLRQNEGLVNSLFAMMKLELDVPDFSTLSRRGTAIDVALPKDEKEKLTILMDSTGLKVYGEGEWKVKKHGWSKHRTWMKYHFGIDSDGEFRMFELTDNSVGDNETVQTLFDQEPATIETFGGDGFYDKRNVYEACRERNIKNIVIPPMKNAKIWNHGNSRGSPHPRDANLRMVRKTSRKQWKEETGYHLRSLAETAVFRFKTIFGGALSARKLANQKMEVAIKTSILNIMKNLGMPDSYPVGG